MTCLSAHQTRAQSEEHSTDHNQWDGGGCCQQYQTHSPGCGSSGAVGPWSARAHCGLCGPLSPLSALEKLFLAFWGALCVCCGIF